MSTRALVVVYLAVLVAANIAVYLTGQAALLLTGLVLVPFDFAVRVRLQEAWAGRGLWLRLFALMIGGGILTVVTLPNAHQVALASVTAFACGSILGAVAYAAIARRRVTWARAVSLATMAAVDSIVFPLLAFDQVSIWLMIGQFAMKWAVSWAVVAFGILEGRGLLFLTRRA